MTELLVHAAAYLETVDMVEPIIDRFMESGDELCADAAQDYHAGHLGDGSGVDRLVATTPHLATKREGSIGLRTKYQQWQSKSVVVVKDGRQVGPSVAPYPTYYAFPRLRGGLKWWVERYHTVTTRTGRIYTRRRRMRPIDTTDLVRELCAAGGTPNVLHAVLGVHYFYARYHTTHHEMESDGIPEDELTSG